MHCTGGDVAHGVHGVAGIGGGRGRALKLIRQHQQRLALPRCPHHEYCLSPCGRVSIGAPLRAGTTGPPDKHRPEYPIPGLVEVHVDITPMKRRWQAEFAGLAAPSNPELEFPEACAVGVVGDLPLSTIGEREGPAYVGNLACDAHGETLTTAHGPFPRARNAANLLAATEKQHAPDSDCQKTNHCSRLHPFPRLSVLRLGE